MPILNWLTRDEDIRTAQNVPYRLLEEVPDLSAGDGGAGNMLIQGDNLEALKALLPFYAGRVKCIYIDPPYNTRSAFEHYDDNLEHTQWLAMMWPRLELLRDLLAEDGSIWVSIDDNEGHYLKVIMDEVFGRRNFYTSFIWQKVDSPNDNKVPDQRRYRGRWKPRKHFLGPDHVPAFDGAENGEEFQCAQAIDSLPGLKFWIRNVARHPNSFWLPTATDKFYPDFVAQLDDGRLLVVEYKGAHIADGPDTAEKRTIGQLWETKSGGKGLFIVVEKTVYGKDMRAQLLEKLFASK